MIRISITIEESGDAARVHLDAAEYSRLEIESEQHRFVIARCQCGCDEAFQPTRKNQKYKQGHRQRFHNAARRKG